MQRRELSDVIFRFAVRDVLRLYKSVQRGPASKISCYKTALLCSRVHLTKMGFLHLNAYLNTKNHRTLVKRFLLH